MFRSLLGFFLGSSTRKAWYDSSELRNECIHTAETLLRLYPTARFFSLGQTPAWIVKSISLIQTNKDSANEVGYIPFSGRFYALKNGRAEQDHQYNGMVYAFYPTSEPKPMHEALYRMLLVRIESLRIVPKPLQKVL